MGRRVKKKSAALTRAARVGRCHEGTPGAHGLADLAGASVGRHGLGGAGREGRGGRRGAQQCATNTKQQQVMVVHQQVN